MPHLNLKLSNSLNSKLDELVAQLTMLDPSRVSNRSHAARLAILELYDRLCDGGARSVSTDLVEDR